ncbi:hypothetical protein CGK93_09895 [Arthrobacter sp. YN]|nr:hypothetical protein CGK93_09895 [Arthrobacter sp. YN]
MQIDPVTTHDRWFQRPAAAAIGRPETLLLPQTGSSGSYFYSRAFDADNCFFRQVTGLEELNLV